MNKKLIIGIISAAVALCIVIVGVVYFLASEFTFNNDPEKDDTSSILTSSVSNNLNTEDSTGSDSNNQSTESGKTDSTQKDNSPSVSTPDSAVTSDDKESTTPSDSKVPEIIDENTPDKAAFYIPKMKASKGDKIKVPVKVVKNPGFMAFQISFSYDKSALKYTGYSKGELVSASMISGSNGTVKLQVVEDSDVKKDGTIIYLEFEVISDKEQESEIKINLTDKSFANFSEEYVVFAAQNGSVTIK